MKDTIVCLMGSTASGKTKLAIELVQKFPFEIISVDSSMVYRGMDIGTAKPTPAELKIAPHRLIDIRDPSEIYSVADFCRDALNEIKDIISDNKLPLLVGGTMLYFKALQQGLSDLPTADQVIRKKLQQEIDELGLEFLYKRLQKVDPLAAKKIKSGDKQRIQRALEIHQITGQTMSELLAKNPPQPLPYKIINITVAPSSKPVLLDRIEKRFDLMLKQGLVVEVEKLYNRGDLDEDLPAIRAVGYRQVWQYLAGKLSYDEMREKAIIATRQLAKRQLTWLRSWGIRSL